MNMMRALADEIAFDLANELRSRKALLAVPHPKTPQLPANQIDQEALSHGGHVDAGTFSNQQILLRRLEQVENTLQKLAKQIRAGQPEPDSHPGTGEDGSKYQNVDTLLKYVDESGAESGVKLVIMNFND